MLGSTQFINQTCTKGLEISIAAKSNVNKQHIYKKKEVQKKKRDGTKILLLVGNCGIHC